MTGVRQRESTEECGAPKGRPSCVVSPRRLGSRPWLHSRRALAHQTRLGPSSLWKRRTLSFLGKCNVSFLLGLGSPASPQPGTAGPGHRGRRARARGLHPTTAEQEGRAGCPGPSESVRRAAAT